MHFETYDDVEKSDLVETVLIEVISRDLASKRYTDVLPLDGGTVGIAHFATGGLASLYKVMDTGKYFGKMPEQMIAGFSAACRPPGRAGNDTGWGCFAQDWWRDGMTAFTSDPANDALQRHAWSRMMRPVIEEALTHGWQESRELAIALGIANSLGHGGFSKIATSHGWNAEKTLHDYVGTDAHRARRRAAIDKAFPLVDSANKTPG